MRTAPELGTMPVSGAIHDTGKEAMPEATPVRPAA